MQLSAAFAPSLATPEHVRIAEQLGYTRAWLYDTPQQSPDVWLVLALAAVRTERIGLGPGVLVPTLRHPMVNAAGAAAIAEIAPGRTVVGFGTGYTGRRALGQRSPIPWSYMTSYITAFQALLRGETVEWDGAPIRMLHPSESAPRFPIDVPVFVAAVGPKGIDIARTLGDGIFVTATSIPAEASDFAAVSCLVWGTVLDDGESVQDERVRASAGPGLAQIYHGAQEIYGAEVVRTLPGGPEWLDVISNQPARERHLAIHDGHCLHLNAADTAAWDAGAHTLTTTVTLTGTISELKPRVAELADRGVTEVVYQPAGDVPRELETFAEVMR